MILFTIIMLLLFSSLLRPRPYYWGGWHRPHMHHRPVFRGPRPMGPRPMGPRHMRPMHHGPMGGHRHF